MQLEASRSVAWNELIDIVEVCTEERYMQRYRTTQWEEMI